MKRKWIVWTVALLLGGCATGERLGKWEGPAAPAAVSVQPWETGRVLNSEHYRIHTTIADHAMLGMLPQVMEGALQEYRKVLPGLALSDKPMNCYIFQKRKEWAEFTARHTGPDSKVYLQISRGGYCLRDWYVAYYIGEMSTYAVASHEGWHQFVNRNFNGRIPPFLEEGLACTFESVRCEAGLPKWNRAINTNRAMGVRRALEENSLWPLEKVVGMHAGQVVDKSGAKIEAFYAQAWAFARFLMDGDEGRYRPGLQKMLADIAAGTVQDPTGSHRDVRLNWNAAGVKPMLERYLGLPLWEIDQRYQLYLRKIAYSELAGQFAS